MKVDLTSNQFPDMSLISFDILSGVIVIANNLTITLIK